MSFPYFFPFYLGGDGPSDVTPAAPTGADTFVDEGSDLTYVDHVALGLSRLLTQFRGKPKIEALLSTWLRPVQGAENIFWSLKLLRGLYTSAGKQLDNLGQLVGEPDRRGQTDERYRVRVLARIAVNLSNGRREDVLTVVSLLLPEGASVYARDLYPAAALYQVAEPLPDYTLPRDLWEVMRAAGAAGVNLDLTYSTSPAVDTLTADSVYGSATVSSQWVGSYHDLTAGGLAAATFG